MIDIWDGRNWKILSYCICVAAQLIFAVTAIVYAKLYATKVFQQTTSEIETGLVTVDGFVTAKGFLTARASQSAWRIGASFYATAMGARAITFPAFYASRAGWLGLMFYALSCGVPIMVISFIGPSLQIRCPKACSLGDFVLYRFGHCARLLVSLIILFNMALAMLAEYMTIGALFQNFVGDYVYPIISIVAFLTVVYTSYGGLATCIFVHAPQTIFSLILIFIITIFVAVTFRPYLPTDFGDRNFLLAPNYYGFTSLYIWPCILMATTLFSDAIWQRVFASESAAALRLGGIIGGLAIIISIFLLGFAGFLATWAGFTDIARTDRFVYLFQVFWGSPPDKWDNGATALAANVTSLGGVGTALPTTITNWMSVLILILAVVLNEAYVSSIKIGMSATFSTYLMNGVPIFRQAAGAHFARLWILIATIPILVVSYQGYEVDSIIAISNLLCSCCFIPVLLGFWDTNFSRTYITESGIVCAFITSILTVSAYVIGEYTWDFGNQSDSIHAGFEKAWRDNLFLTDASKSIPKYLYPSRTWAQAGGHPWDIYIVASGSSVVSLLCFIGTASALRLCGFQGVGISRILCSCCRNFFDEDDEKDEAFPVQKTLGHEHEIAIGSGDSQQPTSNSQIQDPTDTSGMNRAGFAVQPDAPAVYPPTQSTQKFDDINNRAPIQQSAMQVPALHTVSWTPALPWTPAGVRPQTPAVRSNMEAIHGPYYHGSPLMEENSGAAANSYNSYSNEGEYKAYHPAAITLDVEGDIGDA